MTKNIKQINRHIIYYYLFTSILLNKELYKLERLVRVSEEDDLQNLFAPYFLWKDENPLPHCRSYKYDDGQEIRTGTHESIDVSSGEVLKLHVREHRTGTVRDRMGGIIQCRPPTDPKSGAM